MYDDVHSNSSTMGLVPLYNPVPIYSDEGGSDNAQGKGPEKIPVSVPEDQERMSNAPVCLNYMVSEDESFTHVASEGTVFTSSDVDYTVKVTRLSMDQNAMHLLIGLSGRSYQVEALHHLLLSVPSLQLGPQESGWQNQDEP
jgi:hypothetical protein